MTCAASIARLSLREMSVTLAPFASQQPANSLADWAGTTEHGGFSAFKGTVKSFQCRQHGGGGRGVRAVGVNQHRHLKRPEECLANRS